MKSRECNLCVYVTQNDITKDPCFSCLDTPYKKYFEPIQQAKSTLADDIRQKLVVYKILKEQFANGGDESERIYLQMKSAESTVSKLIFDAYVKGDILLYAKGGYNGKPTAI